MKQEDESQYHKFTWNDLTPLSNVFTVYNKTFTSGKYFERNCRAYPDQEVFKVII
jgi:hypothetical protein